MKEKRYVTPLSTIIELGTSSMLANSPTLGVTEDEVDAADTYSNRQHRPTTNGPWSGKLWDEMK
uniref:hypothetical protein n=1 Tax=Alloprevotella sp. TaxID=1872471 RepID=UPI00402583EE